MAEREVGGSSGDKGDRAQTEGGTIRDRDDGKKLKEEGHQWLTVKAEFFYADDGVVASTDPGWIQSEFGFLTGLIDWVGMWTNVRKIVGIVFRPCWVTMVRADEAYTQRMTGEGGGFKERQRQ